MRERRIVVLLGETLLMDTVEASLEDNQELEIVRLDAANNDTGRCLRSLAPDLIIFDFDAPYFECAICHLRDHPGVPLLGLDAACNNAIVLFSQKRTALTANDLVQVIQMQTLQWNWEDEQTYMLLARLGKGFLRFSLN